jgi:serine/threonine protein kinase
MNVGGKILGEGFTGLVKNVNYIKKDKNTLYNELKDINTELVYIIGFKNNNIVKIKISNNYFKNNILEEIKNSKNLAVKFFKGDYIFFNRSSYYFNNEMKGYLKIKKIFKKKEYIEKYTTLKSLFTYEGIDVYGLIINNYCYIFFELCDKTIDKMKFDQKLYNKFEKDIIESIDILNKNEYLHGDLKADNIILCNNNFKLIDWELSLHMGEISRKSIRYMGTLIFNHPLKFYILGIPSYICRYIMYISKIYKIENIWVYKLKKFDKIIKKVIIKFDEIINSGLSRKKINKIYSIYFNNYSIGLLLLFLAEKYKLKPNNELIKKLLDPFIDDFTN